MFIDFRTQKSDVTSANDSKKWPRMKGKFFRRIILRQLSVLLMKISKKHVCAAKIAKKSNRPINC